VFVLFFVSPAKNIQNYNYGKRQETIREDKSLSSDHLLFVKKEILKTLFEPAKKCPTYQAITSSPE
jgi:hypothetical protein